MNEPLAPYYYLYNFRFLIDWVMERYVDLLDESEINFINSFNALDQHSQCLLVRMAGRKGLWFRAEKLVYAEIENHERAAHQLIHTGLISRGHPLTIFELSSLLTKAELAALFSEHLKQQKSARKEILIEFLSAHFPESQSWEAWTNNKLGAVYRIDIQPIVNTLLLLFFGNPYQNLTEFVLQDLGLFRYEKYTIDKRNRIFKNRDEILQYQKILRLREQLAEAVENQPLKNQVLKKESLVSIALQLPSSFESASMERRRGKLLNQLAYEFERVSEHDIALQLYKQTELSPSRERQIRLLEKSGDINEAWLLLKEVLSNPASEQELQIAERMAPRLAKKIGIRIEKKQSVTVVERALILAQLTDDSGQFLRVEEIVRRHFHSESTPCLYAENELINGLFGLWLWPEMFRDTDGAFANPFQTAPLDLYQEAFQENRSGLQELFTLFDDQSHHIHIRDIWNQKNGIANQFVSWHFMDEPTLRLALQCIDREHLKRIFQRLLFDLKANRSGFPDLIQFFPETNSYRMIEVKGPGDRIQDNQQRWLNFFSNNNISAEVCYVRWE